MGMEREKTKRERRKGERGGRLRYRGDGSMVMGVRVGEKEEMQF